MKPKFAMVLNADEGWTLVEVVVAVPVAVPVVVLVGVDPLTYLSERANKDIYEPS